MLTPRSISPGLSGSGLIDFRIRPPLRDDEEDPPVALEPGFERYADLYPLRDRLNVPFTGLVEEMERHGVRGVFHAEFETPGPTRALNERVAELVARRPDLFLGGLAGVDPAVPEALEELRWAHETLGLRGLSVQPCFLGFPATDARLLPLYDYCQSRRVPVAIHCGVNFRPSAPIELGRPLHVDWVAGEFPELPIVISHGGWPWVMEAAAIAWRHPNVHLEFGAVAPRYLVEPGGGWVPIVHWIERQLREAVVFGTDWPVIGYDRFVPELDLLSLSTETLDRYTRCNALEILNNVDRNHAPRTAPEKGER